VYGEDATVTQRPSKHQRTDASDAPDVPHNVENGNLQTATSSASQDSPSINAYRNLDSPELRRPCSDPPYCSDEGGRAEAGQLWRRVRHKPTGFQAPSIQRSRIKRYLGALLQAPGIKTIQYTLCRSLDQPLRHETSPRCRVAHYSLYLGAAQKGE
jgi:hypothetical protein